jgi:hypothetical protein
VCLLSLTLVPLPARGQAAYDYSLQGGEPAFSTNDPFPGGFVNIANGNVHLEIPLINIPQRGKLQAWQKLIFDNKKWYPFTFEGTTTWTASGALFWRGSSPYPNQTFRFYQQSANQYCPPSTYGPVTWTSGDGATHVFPISSGCPGDPTTWSVYALDGSGYRMSITCAVATYGYCSPGSIFQPDGTQITLALQTSTPRYAEDSNGNKVANGSNLTMTDTLGHFYSYSFPGVMCSYPKTFSYPSSQTSSNSDPGHFLTVTDTFYCGVPIKTNFQVPGVTDVTGNDGNQFLYSLALPDGSTYKFTYDCDSGSGLPLCGSPSGQTAYYGDLISITLPTGGVITFSYQNFTDANGNTNRWIASRTQGGGTWRYTPQKNCGSACQTVTITNPAGDQTVYKFTLAQGHGSWATNVTYYHGASTGSPILSIANQYGSLPTDPVLGSWAFTQIQSTTVTIPSSGGNLVKTTKYTYDQSLSYSFNGKSYAGSRGQLLSMTEYGFNNSTTPIRTARFSYLNPVGQPGEVDWYTSRLDMVTDVKVSDASNIVRAETQISYDDFPVAPISGIFNHDDTSPNLNRGNPTTVRRWISGNNFATTTFHYDSTGQVTQINDPNSNQFNLSYNDNFRYDSLPAQNPPNPVTWSGQPTNAYPTQITLPLIGTVSAGYYWGSGKNAFSQVAGKLSRL